MMLSAMHMWNKIAFHPCASIKAFVSTPSHKLCVSLGAVYRYMYVHIIKPEGGGVGYILWPG